MKRFLREIVGTIVLAIIVFVLLQTTFQTFIVVGSSIEPIFQWTQRLLTNKATYHFHEPERGDVIVFHPVANWRVDYIKRVIALPGDTVEIKKGVVYVNGSPLDEHYIKEPAGGDFPYDIIPNEHYFVLGDNRKNSNDSRNGWTVPRQNIIGKVWLSIWPPNRWGFVPNYPLEEQLVSPAE